MIFCIVSFLVLSTALSAKEVSLYEWEQNRDRYELSGQDKNLSEIILRHHTQYDYVFENSQFVMYSTIHRIVYVNNNEAVQKHNRIVISMTNALELVKLRARAINKDGKTVNFDESNLKELKNESNGKAYKIFAIEGVELGSEIEYYFVRKMRPSVFDRVFLQFDVPVKMNSFMLTCPEHLQFDFKTYHDFPAVKEEENEDLNVYLTSMKDVPALKAEAFSNFDPNRKRLEFKLAYNTARSKSRLYTWDEAAKTFYVMLTTVTKEDQKALSKFVKSLNDNSADELEKRIKNVEQAIKASIQVSEGREESLAEISSILKVKLASHQGMTRLFLAVFNQLDIQCNPVLTCSRESIRFDGEFDTWAFLDDYVLHFPDTKKFLSPYVFECRYPFVQPEFTAQKGLFMQPYTSGNIKSAFSVIGEIPAIDYSYNIDNLNLDIFFVEDLASNEIKQLREFGGYNAAYFTPYYEIMSRDQKQAMIDQLAKQTAPDAVINKWTATATPDGNSNNFQVSMDFHSSHFVERAGSKILFKIGELIGPQIEMYRDDKRTVPVENDFNRMYNRIIKVHLPEGYRIKNADDLLIDIEYTDEAEVPFSFKSEYNLKDGVLTVHIQEFYKEIYAPISRYEDFRKVVNAAADFNKITLVLERNN